MALKWPLSLSSTHVSEIAPSPNPNAPFAPRGDRVNGFQMSAVDRWRQLDSLYRGRSSNASCWLATLIRQGRTGRVMQGRRGRVCRALPSTAPSACRDHDSAARSRVRGSLHSRARSFERASKGDGHGRYAERKRIHSRQMRTLRVQLRSASGQAFLQRLLRKTQPLELRCAHRVRLWTPALRLLRAIRISFFFAGLGRIAALKVYSIG
jgi:hypothetical protein